MDHRKLVKSGATSYTISIPIAWIRKHGLNAGSEVSVEENDIGDLTIEALQENERRGLSQRKSQTLKIENLMDEQLRIEILRTYVEDDLELTLECPEISRRIAAIREIIGQFIGLDVIDQGTNHVTLKNFFTLDNEMSPNVIVRKMININRSACEAISRAFRSGASQDILQDLSQHAVQVRKLANVAQKGVVALLDKPLQMRKFQLNHLQVVKLAQQAHAQRRIATALQEIASLLELFDKNSEDWDLLSKLFKEILTANNTVNSATANNDLPLIKTFLADAKVTDKRIADAAAQIDDIFAMRLLGYVESIHRTLKEVAFVAII